MERVPVQGRDSTEFRPYNSIHFIGFPEISNNMSLIHERDNPGGVPTEVVESVNLWVVYIRSQKWDKKR